MRITLSPNSALPQSGTAVVVQQGPELAQGLEIEDGGDAQQHDV